MCVRVCACVCVSTFSGWEEVLSFTAGLRQLSCPQQHLSKVLTGCVVIAAVHALTLAHTHTHTHTHTAFLLSPSLSHTHIHSIYSLSPTHTHTYYIFSSSLDRQSVV